MQEVKLTKKLESGEWAINIFEIGNTYHISAECGDKSVHFMFNKRKYLEMLLDKQKDNTSTMNHKILSCTGREFLTESEFDEMKNLLITHMDADLSEEKILYGIVPEEK